MEKARKWGQNSVGVRLILPVGSASYRKRRGDRGRYMAQPAENPQTLNSWKEIASFLDRGVRTVQRWERDLQLPVHLIGAGKRSPVYASVRELKFWMVTAETDSVHSRPPARPVLVKPNSKNANHTTIEESHRLIAESMKLVQSLAESSVRHQRQAELLKKHILEIRARIR